MIDQYTLYEIGVQVLLTRLGKEHPKYNTAQVYRQRLSENLEDKRVHGDSRDREATRSEILDELNRLTQSTLGVTFTDLYRKVCDLFDEGNTAEKQQNWQAAQEKYQEAVKMAAPYDVDIRQALKRVEDTLANIGKLIKEGQTAEKSRQWLKALKKYREVLHLDSHNETAIQGRNRAWKCLGLLGGVVALVLVLVGVGIYWLTRPRPPAPTPIVSITSHHNGDIVEQEATISGTYQNLGKGWSLWGLVRTEDDNYWVQEHANIDESGNRWIFDARFGREDTRDIGHVFDFIVLVVKEGSDAEKGLRIVYGREQNYIKASDFPSEVRAMDSITLTLGSPTDYWLADFWANERWEGTPGMTRAITARYIFQEWQAAPFEGGVEQNWTARFVRRLNFPEEGEYCFYRKQNDQVTVSLDNTPLDFPAGDAVLDITSVCRTLSVGVYEARVDLVNLTERHAWVEFWYTGPGLDIPTQSLAEPWRATFYPTTDLSGLPVLQAGLPGEFLDFTAIFTDYTPVVNFSAVFTRLLTVAEAGTYRFDVAVDDGVRLFIDTDEVLDMWHSGYGAHKITTFFSAGEHSLRFEYNEYRELQSARLTWTRIAEPAPPIQRVLFVSDPEGQGDEIFIANADGANPRRLTHNTTTDRDPAWSPDGQRIVFAADPDGDGGLDIYVMAADGSHPQRLTQEGAQPRWSPDGSRIVFVRWITGREQNLWVIHPDGAGEHPLTTGETVDYNPDWAPDGAQIVFESHRDGNAEIYAMNADGSNVRNLSHSPDTWEGMPAWSPDGKRIAFATEREGNTDIYMMDADGSNVKRVTSWDMADTYPDWSADGRWLLFQGKGEYESQVYRVNPDSDADRMPLTANAANHEEPQGSPPGYGYQVTNFTNGDDVTQGAIVATNDFIWTGGKGGLVRWNRADPQQVRKYTTTDGLASNQIRNILLFDATRLWITVGWWPFYDPGWGELTFAPTEQWRTFTLGDGLEARSIYDLHADAQGRIWAATRNGVWRYDGQTWRQWNGALYGSVVYQASDGALWFEVDGTAEVLRYEPETNTAQTFDLKALLNSDAKNLKDVTTIIESVPGELWFGTIAGAVHYTGETWEIPDDRLSVWITDILHDEDGMLWFGLQHGPNGLARRNPAGDLHFYPVQDLTGNITALTLDVDGTLWAAGDGLNRYDRSTDTWTPYRADVQNYPNHVGAISQDARGDLWFGHDIFSQSGAWNGGITHYHADTDEWDYFSGYGPHHVITPDRKDTLWVGFGDAGGGVCPYDLTTQTWGTCYTTATVHLESNNVDAIAQTRDDALWFGTNGGGLTRMQGGRWQTYRQAESDLLSDNVHCLLEDAREDALWVTTDAGINRLYYRTQTWERLETALEVVAIARDGEQGLWLGAREGLYYYDYAAPPRRIETGPANPFQDASTCQQRLWVDRYGDLWVGTDEGLYRRTAEGGWIRLTTMNGLASNYILALYEAADGALWVGTPGGVNRLERQ